MKTFSVSVIRRQSYTDSSKLHFKRGSRIQMSCWSEKASFTIQIFFKWPCDPSLLSVTFSASSSKAVLCLICPFWCLWTVWSFKYRQGRTHWNMRSGFVDWAIKHLDIRIIIRFVGFCLWSFLQNSLFCGDAWCSVTLCWMNHTGSIMYVCLSRPLSVSLMWTWINACTVVLGDYS